MKPLVEEPTHPEGALGCWDDMAVEVECAEFLYALVRLLKPGLVLESGSGRGLASVHIAAALRDNGYGLLLTYEPLDRFREEATRRLAGYPAEVFASSSLDYQGDPPDLVFLDSGPDFRPAEIDLWLQTDVRLLVHDAHRYTLPGGVLLETPRGLWMR